MSGIPGLGNDDLPNPGLPEPEFAFAVDLVNTSVKIVKKTTLVENNAYLFLEDVPTNLYKVLTDKEKSKDIDPKDDDYVHCEKCGVFRKPWCLQHPLYWCPDKDVSKNPTAESSPERAALTAPPFLKIRMSRIPKAGNGVYTTSELPAGMVFGPYQGTLVEDKEQADQYGYAWEIRERDRSVYIDGSNARCSNWMRYINSSRHDKEQNMLAFQYNGSVYYRVIRPIQINEELLVWYGAEFGKTLGVLSTQSCGMQGDKKKSRSGVVFEWKQKPIKITTGTLLW